MFPFAKLEATILNMMGGKRQRERKPDDDPPLQPHELFDPFERLPWYARPEWVEAAGVSIAPDAAKDFLQHRRDMPDWVIAIAPLDALRRAADTITA